MPIAIAGVDVVVDPIRDVVQGESIYYPVYVTNNNPEVTTVTIGLKGLDDWAIYRVDPYNTITLSPDESKELFIYLKTDDNAPGGVKDFFITAHYDGVEEQKPLRLAVLGPEGGKKPSLMLNLSSTAAAIVAVLVIMLIIGLIFLLDRKGGF